MRASGVEWSGAIINDIIRAEVGEGEGARPSFPLRSLDSGPAREQGRKQGMKGLPRSDGGSRETGRELWREGERDGMEGEGVSE